jgi:hypothetical protein
MPEIRKPFEVNKKTSKGKDLEAFNDFEKSRAFDKPIRGEVTLESIALKKFQEWFPEDKKVWTDWKTFTSGSVGKVEIKTFINSDKCEREGKHLVDNYLSWKKWFDANRAKKSTEGNEELLYAILAMEALEKEEPEQVFKEITNPDLVKANLADILHAVASFYKDENKREAFQKCMEAANITKAAEKQVKDAGNRRLEEDPGVDAGKQKDMA